MNLISSTRIIALIGAAIVLAAIVAVAIGVPDRAGAAGSSSPSFSDSDSSKPSADELYAEAEKKIEDGEFADAIDLLDRANRMDRNNPDIINLLAYSYRKQGNLETAFRYYKRAIDLRPVFPEAREYLGEAHLEAAMRQIRELKSYGSDAEAQLVELVDALKQAASGVDGVAAASASDRSW